MKARRITIGMAMVMAPALAIALAACAQKSDTDGATQRQQIGQSWKYETQGKTALAYIGSANSVVTPTAPDTFAVLLLDRMTNGLTRVTVKLVGAPFACDLSDCAVKAGVGQDVSQSWHGRLTDARDGVAIPPSQKAMKIIEGADRIGVELEVAPKVKQVFYFDTAGLKWS